MSFELFCVVFCFWALCGIFDHILWEFWLCHYVKNIFSIIIIISKDLVFNTKKNVLRLIFNYNDWGNIKNILHSELNKKCFIHNRKHRLYDTFTTFSRHIQRHWKTFIFLNAPQTENQSLHIFFFLKPSQHNLGTKRCLHLQSRIDKNISICEWLQLGYSGGRP